ncbi:hypothetical protein [Simkania sp.]|uniref:hypothetical protein n=1 Tax=Simkania sp. TaxID=34094 RepID=UPI003B5224B4
MSNIQQIDASKVEVSFAATHSESDTSNGLLLDLHEALQTLLSTQDQQDAPDTKAAVLKHLNSIGDRIKEIQKTTHIIPSEGIKIFFYLLAELNNATVVNSDLEAFLGQANNAFGIQESKDAEQQFVKAAKDYYKATHRTWWQKALHFIVKIVTYVVLPVTALVTADPGMLMATVFMATMSATGGTKKMSDDITSGLKKIMPKDVAQVLGGILTVAINFTATLGLGAVASVETIGVEIGDSAVEETSEGFEVAESASEVSESASSNVKIGITDKYQLNLKRMLSIGFMGGSATLAQEAPQIAEGFVDLLPVSEDVKKTLGKVILVLLELIAVVGMIYGGYSATTSDAATANVLQSGMDEVAGKAGKFFSELMPKFFNFLETNGDTIRSTARFSKYFSFAAGGTAQIGIAGYTAKQAVAEKDLGHVKASLNEIMSSEKMTQTSTKQIIQDAEQMMQIFDVMIQNVGSLYQINNVAADYLAQ